MRDLEILHLRDNDLSGSLPESLCDLVRMKNLDLSGNRLTGMIPSCMADMGGASGTGGMQVIRLQNNQIDSMPNLQGLLQEAPGIFEIGNNRLTFDDIIPTLDHLSGYAPQDSIFVDTVLFLAEGEDLVLDLGVDAGMVNNTYQWYKDGTPYAGRIVGDNRMMMDRVEVADAGVYWVEITNPAAPQLRLSGRRITVEVDGCNARLDAEEDRFLISEFSEPTEIDVLRNDILPAGLETEIVIIEFPVGGELTIEDGNINYLPFRPIVSLDDNFVYQVCSTECPEVCDQAEVRISFQDNCLVEAEETIPNSFTPNGDDINDLFDPLEAYALAGCPVPADRAQLMIVNRWGEVIFKRELYEPWAGNNSAGEPVPQGVYYFVLTLDLEEEITVKGGITVLLQN